MAIALRIPGGGVQILYFQFLAKISIYATVELQPIILYDCSRDAKLTDNVLSDKPGDISVFNRREGFGLYPFAEVVRCDQ